MRPFVARSRGSTATYLVVAFLSGSYQGTQQVLAVVLAGGGGMEAIPVRDLVVTGHMGDIPESFVEHPEPVLIEPETAA